MRRELHCWDGNATGNKSMRQLKESKLGYHMLVVRNLIESYVPKMFIVKTIGKESHTN